MISPSSAPESVSREAILPPAQPAPTSRSKIGPNSVTRSELPAARSVQLTEPEPEDVDDRITHVSDTAELAQERDRVVLLRLDGVDAGRIWRLSKTSCVVGRNTQSQLILDDGGVSRQHARIDWNGRAHVLDDMGSRNGTFVRGVRQTRVELQDGDLIQFGPHACFRYTVTDLLQERLLGQLFESSTRDALTGAYNRRHFDERLRAELAYAVRHSTELSLVMFDIDFFKKINDTRGHAAGDAVIRHIARLATGQLRSEDVFARYGGEEFVMLLRGTGPKDAVRVAERLRTSIDALAATFEGKRIPATVSAGCAHLGECPKRSPEELLGKADGRLYAAKKSGRNRVLGPR